MASINPFIDQWQSMPLFAFFSHLPKVYAAKVGVIESYHQGYPWGTQYYQAILDNLTA